MNPFADLVPSGSQNSQSGAFSDLIPGGTTQPQTPAQPQSLSDSIWNGLAGLGKGFSDATGATAIGQGLGTAAFNVGQLAQGKNPFTNPTKVGGVTQPGINPASDANIPQMAGGVLQAGATIAGAGIGGGVGDTIASRVGDAALKYGATGLASGTGQGLQQGKNLGDSVAQGLKTGAEGALLGAGTQGVAESIPYISNGVNKLLSATSNTPEEAFRIITSQPDAAAQIGTATPQGALKDTQTVVRGLRTQLSDNWGQSVDQIAQEFDTQRIGLPSKTEKLLTQVEDLVGGLQNVPADTSNMSAKELINLTKDVNAQANATAFKISPEGVKVRALADQLKELGVNAFGGKGGTYDTLYSNYSAQKGVLDAANQIASAYKTGNPINQTTALSRLQKIFDENKPAYLEAIQGLQTATGKDVLSEIAASKFKPILPSAGKDLPTSVLRILALPLTSPRFASQIAQVAAKAGTVPGARALTNIAIPAMTGALGAASPTGQ